MSTIPRATRCLFVFAAVLLFAPPRVFAVPPQAIFPLPAKMQLKPGTFTLEARTPIVTGTDVAAKAVAQQLVAVLAPATGYKFEIKASAGAVAAIVLKQDASLSALGDEGYVLEVTPKQIKLSAPKPAGLFWAVQTLRQLLPPQIFSTTAVNNVAWSVPCVKIEDQPRFSWRGLMLDSGHDFQNLAFVYRYIDLLALHKFNTFHWHLTDLGTWAIEIKGRPELLHAKTRAPGVRPGFYTQEQVRQVVAYAAQRFITVVPEIDMPGHSVPALLAYPELDCPIPYAEKDGKQDGKKSRPWQYCVANEKVYAFLEDVLSQVIDLFPSPYIHIGGDSTKDRWKACPLCQAKMKAEGLKSEDELQSAFIRRIEKFLQSKHRRLIGWDEILEGGLAPNATVMSWRGMKGGIAAAKAGHDVVMTPTSHVYFDAPQTPDRKSDPDAPGSKAITLETVFGFNPIPPELTAAEVRHVLGGEGEMWSDHHPAESSIDRLVYPRAVALSEVLWSPARARDYPAFTAQLPAHLQRLDVLGVKYRPLQ